MTKIEIKHRYTGAVLFATEVADDDAYPMRTALQRADLADADLAGADLARAWGVPSGIEAKDPPEPYVRSAPTSASLLERARRYRERHPEVPVVERLDAKILDVISRGEGQLEMGAWHSCETTHCRGGWAVNFAGAAGFALEKRFGTQHAAAMIYRASSGRASHFFATNEAALEDIKRCAAEQTEEAKS